MNRHFAYFITESKDKSKCSDTDFRKLLNEAGVCEDNIFTDTSGNVKLRDRSGYKAVLSSIGKGDTLFLRSLSELGEDPPRIIVEWNRLTKDKGVDIVVLDEPTIDTRRMLSADKRKEEVGEVMNTILIYMRDNWDDTYTLSHRSTLRRRVEADVAVEDLE